jgi:putative transposase
VPHDVRDQAVDFVRRWSEKTEIGVGRFIHWLGVTASKFYDWRQRYGCVNEHNSWVPRDFWLELWEKEAIIDFHLKNPLEGYRRLTFMMLDADVCGCQSGERLAGLEASRATIPVESQAVAQGDRF